MTTNPAAQPGEISLFDVISWVETRCNSMAVRFEPATYEKLSASRTDSQKAIIANIIKMNGCSWGTALMIYSSSFGEVQLMGFNLYGPQINYQKNIIEFCSDKLAQATTFGLFLKQVKLTDITVAQLAASNVARARFALTYNGGAAYADQILLALKALNIPVTE